MPLASTARIVTAGAVASVLAVAGLTVASPAIGAPADGPRICPTEDFLVGAGWGADRGRRSHTGIDLGGKRGTPIYAVEDGVIDRTKRQSNGALQIVMKGRSGPKYYYGHMDTVLVKGGQRVDAGEVIGLMGDTGSPGAVHLHFEYWKSGGESATVDPEPLVRDICAIRKDGRGDRKPSGESVPAADAAKPAEAPTEVEPEQPKQETPPAIAGEVFSN